MCITFFTYARHMKNLFFFICFFALAFAAGAQDNYKQFRTGRFAYGPWYVVKGDTLKFPSTVAGKSIVVRTEKKQYEYIENKVAEFDIEWESDSVYIMKFVSPDSGGFKKGDTIRVTILGATGNTYRYRSEAKIGNVESILIKTGD